MRPYKAIFLDADDTLFDYPAAEREALFDCVRKFSLEGEAETVLAAYREYNAAVWRAHERGEMNKATLKVERFHRLAAHFGWGNGFSATNTSEHYLATLSGQRQLLDGAYELVQTLSASHPLGLITNGIASVQRGRLSESPITPHFSCIVISEEAGAAKPDPRIFVPAYDALAVSAAEVLFIGDSVTSDMLAARNAGIDFCWFNPQGLPIPYGFAPVFNARSLPQIGEWVNAVEPGCIRNAEHVS